MEFHEVAAIFPMMQDDEYQALVEDIRKNGLQEPVWTYQGKIIDGRNRYKACQEIGMEPRYQEWNGSGSLVSFVVSLNLNRRHLTSSQRAIVALDIEKYLAEEAAKNKVESGKLFGEGHSKPQEVLQIFAKPLVGPIHAAKQASTVAGTNHTYVTDAKKIVEQAPELRDIVSSGKMSIPEAKQAAKLPESERYVVVTKVLTGEAKNVKEGKSQVKQEQREEAMAALTLSPEDYNLFHCSVEELHLRVDPASIDLIITDPPYPEQFLEVYKSLSQFAEYALKPGGSAIVMTGQSYLPTVMQNLSEHLKYHWTGCYLTPGAHITMYQRGVNCGWKPLLWYTKGTYAGEWVSLDVFKSEQDDKKHHYWGQSISGMLDIVERFTRPGQTICDPFLGGGTTALAASHLKRRFVGCDIDEKCIQTTLQRIQESEESAA